MANVWVWSTIKILYFFFAFDIVIYCYGPCKKIGAFGAFIHIKKTFPQILPSGIFNLESASYSF